MKLLKLIDALNKAKREGITEVLIASDEEHNQVGEPFQTIFKHRTDRLIILSPRNE